MTRSNWASAVFAVWAAVVSVRYGSAVLQSIRSPFNYGDDNYWFAILLIASAALIVFAAIMKRAAEAAFAVLILVCTLVLVLSGTFLAALAATGLLALGHQVGRRLLKSLRLEVRDLALTIPLGLIPPALAGFALAALHLLAPVWIAAVLVVLLVWSRYDGSVKPPLEMRLHESVPLPTELRLPLLLITPLIFLNLTWAVAPEIQFDANNYHLAVSRIYLDNSGFIDLPYFFHSYFYRFIEMLFTIAMAFGGAAAAKLLSFGFGLLAAIAVYSLGEAAFDRKTGVWAAAFFYTTPIVSWLSGTAYVDNAAALFTAATLIAFIRWLRNEDHTGWLYAASLLAGAAAAVKINAIFGLIALTPVAIWKLRARPGVLIAAAALALVVAMPWYGLTYHWTGNPVFPMLNGVFKSPRWDLANSVMDANEYGVGVSAAAFVRAPFRLTWNTSAFGVATPRGAAGVMLLFAFPFGAVWLIGRNRAAALLAASGVCGFLLWMLTFQNVRYYVHTLPVICVIGAATFLRFSSPGLIKSGSKIALASLLAIQIPGTITQFWNIDERFPLARAFGIESADAFLTRSLGAYEGAKFLNTRLQPGERIVGVNVEDSRLYVNAPLETFADSTAVSSLRKAPSTAGVELRDALKAAGLVYIFARRDAIKAPPPWHPYLKAEFMQLFATPVFENVNSVVFRLRD